MRTTAISAAALLTAVTARDWVALAAARASADEPRACGPNCMDLRTPYLESSGWGAARYCAAPPCFVVRRLSKTGGSFLSGVVERVVARRRRAVIKDDVPVPCAYRSNASLAASFFVGVVRNPCEFYASLAQDVPEQAFAEPYGAAEPWFRGPVVTKAELRATRPQRNGSGPAPAALRAWLDATLRGDLGYFSYHFWVSYVRNECVDTDMTASDRRAPCPRDACAPEDFARDAAAVDAAALADCWLRTETLLADLETCLRRYVARAPAAAGDVDWSALAALAAATPAEAAVAVNVDKRKRPDHPHGHHGYCGAYADAIADVVQRADRHIFRAFNYTTCCGAAQASIVTSG